MLSVVRPTSKIRFSSGVELGFDTLLQYTPIYDVYGLPDCAGKILVHIRDAELGNCVAMEKALNLVWKLSREKSHTVITWLGSRSD